MLTQKVHMRPNTAGDRTNCIEVYCTMWLLSSCAPLCKVSPFICHLSVGHIRTLTFVCFVSARRFSISSKGKNSDKPFPCIMGLLPDEPNDLSPRLCLSLPCFPLLFLFSLSTSWIRFHSTFVLCWNYWFPNGRPKKKNRSKKRGWQCHFSKEKGEGDVRWGNREKNYTEAHVKTWFLY